MSTPLSRGQGPLTSYKTIGCSLPEKAITSADSTYQKLDGTTGKVSSLGDSSLPDQLKQKLSDHAGRRAPTQLTAWHPVLAPTLKLLHLCSQAGPLSVANGHLKVMETTTSVDMVDQHQPSERRTSLKLNTSALAHLARYGTILRCNTISFVKMRNTSSQTKGSLLEEPH